MADTKFSQFSAGSAIAGANTTVGLQGGLNVKWTYTQVNTFVAANIAGAPYVIGDIIFADSTSTLNKIPDIAVDNVLLSGGVGVAPSYGKVTIDHTTIDQQDVYDHSADGNVVLANGKHQGYSSTGAVFYTPSMSDEQFAAVENLPNGGQAWNVESDRPIYNAGTPESPNPQLGAYLSDITAVTNNSVYGEMFFTGNTFNTSIEDVGVPVKINGGYTSGALQGFTHDGNGTLTYTETLTRTLSIKVSLTNTPVSSSSNISFFIFKNGVDIGNTTQTVDFDPSIPSQKSVTISGSITLSQNDNVNVFLSNNTSTDTNIVGNLNCFITSIGGVNEGSAATLQTAYDPPGDGTITMSVDKPFSMESTDNAIIPTIQTNQLDTPTNGTIISRFPFLADSVEYGAIQTTATTVGQHSTNAWIGLASGTPTNILTYTGSNKTAHSPNFLTVGSNAQGVNSTVATVNNAVTSYGTGTGTFLMWNSVVGNAEIPPNTFGPGDTIEIDVTGQLHIAVPDTAVVTASTFNIVVGGIININSSNINPSTLPASFNGVFQWRFKIVRTPGTSNNNGLTISGSGFFEDTNGSMKVITFPSGVATTLYLPSTTYPISVNYQKGISSPAGAVDYIAYGLNIRQYS